MMGVSQIALECNVLVCLVWIVVQTPTNDWYLERVIREFVSSLKS